MTAQMSLPFLCELVREALEKRGKFVLRARGFSMAPFIEDGEDVQIENAGFEDAHFGDVICYAIPQHESTLPALRIHRVLWKTNEALFVKGDTLLYMEKVFPRQVFGKVTAVRKKHGWEKCKSSAADVLASLPFLYGYAVLYKLKAVIVPEKFWNAQPVRFFSGMVSSFLFVIPRALSKIFSRTA